MIHHGSLNLNAIEAMQFLWTSIASKDKLTEKFIIDIANTEPFQWIYNDEFTAESVRRSLSALSNREPFTGNKTENRFYSRNLMILEYIDTLHDKINALKGIRLKDIIDHLNTTWDIKDMDHLEVVVVPTPFDTFQRHENKIILNFFKFHLVDGILKADDMSIEEILKTALIS